MLTKKHTIVILTILYLSLFLGIYLNEDSLGGAFSDYKGLFYISEKFILLLCKSNSNRYFGSSLLISS